jgi:hypothetical protein
VPPALAFCIFVRRRLWAVLRTSQVLASVSLDGGADGNAQQGEKLNVENRRAALGNRFIDPTLLFEGVCFGVQTEAAVGRLAQTSSRTRRSPPLRPWPSSKLGHRENWDHRLSVSTIGQRETKQSWSLVRY